MPLSPDKQRDWLLDEIKKDADSYIEAKKRKAGSERVFYGRLDALFRVARFFFGWDVPALNKMMDGKLAEAGFPRDVDPADQGLEGES